MKNRKRLLMLALLCMALAFSVLGLTACGNKGDNRDPGKSAYEIWLDNGFTGTEQDFLNWLKNQSNNADSLGLSFALTDEDTYSVSVGLATERSVIVIPATYNNKPVTKIANKAFNECKNLKKVTIPDSVTSIGDSAFSRCSSLTSITIPDSVTSIGEYALQYCKSLTSVTIGSGVTGIGSRAFNGCPIEYASAPAFAFGHIGKNNLKTAIITSGDSIRQDAFYGCTSLTSITIPDSVTSIGNSAFSGCTSLTSITIPDSVTSIGNSAFYECTSLNAVYITDIAAWCNIKFNNNSFRTYNLYLNGELVTKLVIPDSVTSIGWYAFYDCTSLTSVTIGNGVTWIGKEAFRGCKSLTCITIPDSVTSIGDYAFCNCDQLKTINYTGSEAQWESISKGYAWAPSTAYNINYNYVIPTNENA